jgi:hypothetical protein
MDERLAIRSRIRRQIKEALSADPTADVEKLKERFEKEAAPDLERLDKRSAKLDARKKELESQRPTEEENQQFRTARTLADFQTEVEILAEVWNKKRMQEKREFVNLLVNKVMISIPATHWIKMDISWSNPTWPDETLYIYREQGFHATWTDNERDVIREYYPKGERTTLQSLLPHRSWNAIKKEARSLSLQCARFSGLTDLEPTATLSDHDLCKSLGIKLGSRETVLQVHNPKCGTASGCDLSVLPDLNQVKKHHE